MSNIVDLQSAIKNGEVPKELLQGAPFVGQPIIPRKVQEFIENHIKEGFEYRDKLKDRIENRRLEEKSEDVTLIMEVLIWLVIDRLPIEAEGKSLV